MSFVRFVEIDVGATSTTTLVAAVSGKKIRLVQLYASVGTNSRFTLASVGTATSNLNGTPRIGTNAPHILPFNGYGWVETVSGEALVLTSSQGAISGVMGYQLV